MFILNLNPASASDTSNKTDDEYEDVMISYLNEAGEDSILDNSSEILYEFEYLPFYKIRISASDIGALEEDANVNIVEEDIFSTLEEEVQIIDDEFYTSSNSSDLNWNLAAINMKQAHENNYLGQDVKIGIIDTGIANHTNLTIDSGVSTVKYTTSWEDDHGHGSQVAGIINSKRKDGLMGISPNAKIYAIKSLDQNGQGKLSNILEGIDWAIKNDMDILNLSFGSEFHSKPLEDILNEAENQGILLVGAAGNSADGSNDTLEYPAKYDSVISVGSISSNFQHSLFSSSGPKLEVVAPGERIQTTHLYNQYAYVDGTSFAAPHVTSLIAIYKNHSPNLTNDQIRGLLVDNAIDLGKRDDDRFYGFGLANYKIHDSSSQSLTGIAQNSKTNVHLAPNTTSKILRTYNSGHNLKFKSFSEDWHIAIVYINGIPHTGYIKTDDVETSHMESINLEGIALNSPTHVYASNSKKSKVLRSYKQGNILHYKTFSENWYIATVYLKGTPTTGFIPKTSVENLLDQDTVSVRGIAINNPTNIYSKASTESNLLRSYDKGHILRYRAFSKNWYMATVYLNGTPTTGFIPKKSVENLLTDDVVSLQGIALQNPTFIYDKASTSSDILRSYSQGSILRYRTFSENWHMATVYLNGNRTTGFIHVEGTENLVGYEDPLQSIALKQPTNVYRSPAGDSNIIRSYNQGQLLYYRTFSENWYIATVYLNGKPTTGYIQNNSVK